MMTVDAAHKAKNTSTRSDKLSMIPFPVTRVEIDLID